MTAAELNRVEELNAIIQTHTGMIPWRAGVTVTIVNKKIMIRAGNAFIRERRVGRGIDLRRLFNYLYNHHGLGHPVSEPWIVGKMEVKDA